MSLGGPAQVYLDGHWRYVVYIKVLTKNNKHVAYWQWLLSEHASVFDTIKVNRHEVDSSSARDMAMA